MDTAKTILKKYWGYTEFRASQEQIINNILEGKNVVAILPTGGGKSICYQVPALLKEGVCLVVSPLIALMNDQVNNLKEKGIKAIAITSNLNQEQAIQAFDNLQFGNFKFLYLSPEKLQSEFIQQKLKQLNINLIAVDEAHCISEWGHDFRPAYLKIPILRELDIKAPILALTATATNRVLDDLMKNLEIQNATVFKQSLVRKNLSLNISRHEDVYFELKKRLSSIKNNAIIYVNSRRRVQDISNYLNRNNFKSSYYHAGLSNEEKQRAFMDWMEEKKPIIVATNAFGMGIDKDNVELIVHIDLPFSLENYMQEAGRAGRDGNKASSIVFANDHNINNLKNQFEKGIVTVDFAKEIYKNLNKYFYIAYGEKPEQIFEFDLATFCNTYKTNILRTYNALKLLEREQILLFSEGFNKQSTLKFIMPPDKVLDYAERTNNNLIKIILRTHGGIFDHFIKINESVLANKLETEPSKIKSLLLQLEKDGLLSYSSNKSTSQLQFLIIREDERTINSIAKDIIQYNGVKQEKINSIVNYATNDSVCRSKLLLRYFDEKLKENCGICDVCLSQINNSTNYKNLPDQILELLKANEQLSSKEIASQLNVPSATLLKTLQNLLDTDKITINSQNKLEIKRK
ncbi:RecQ family ATP-dependent DNA helicase [Aureibaculum sp. 2210JD6-5]|uniref:RecQ family ATP-dependent DNA helicase n=1 Tax=Aureibaculum sp. 2210JD6-5 TaxID=3103957 RepID=UPI002AAF063A|nr:RecQ family ATP-dependent DNA helicase [Aureibaculum sp. 2210JD6-5]MDY7395159.1 RecQ family ATP-dependent DNA helicase [Aureibaculum sp. 2210JD6-5]